MSLKKSCIKAIKSHKTSYKSLPKKLRDEIQRSKPCCLALTAHEALKHARHGHYKCFVEAADTLNPAEFENWTRTLKRGWMGGSTDKDHRAVLKYIHSRIGLLPVFFRKDASLAKHVDSLIYATAHGLPPLDEDSDVSDDYYNELQAELAEQSMSDSGEDSGRFRGIRYEESDSSSEDDSD